MEKLDCAYVAGYFDGEGSISIATPYSKRNDKRYHRLHVSITSTDFETLDWFQQHFGGVVTSHRLGVGNAKPSARWQVTGQIAEQFIRTIIPYLRHKRERAEIALAIRALKVKQGGQSKGRKGVVRVTSEIYEQREALRQRLLELNKRGT